MDLIRHRGDDGLNRWLQQRALANQGSTGVDTNLVTWSRSIMEPQDLDGTARAWITAKRTNMV